MTRYAEIVRRLLLSRRVEPPSALPAARRRLVAAVEDALRARARRRMAVRRGLMGTGLGVAASVALIVAFRQPWNATHELADGGSGRALLTRTLTVLDGAPTEGRLFAPDGTPGPAVRGAVVGAGFRLIGPPTGQVSVGTAEGTRLTLEPRSDLALLENGPTRRFSLRAGVVSVRVARLFAGERFVIETADAEIEVRDSTFRVALVAPDAGCAGGTATRVSVSEGTVSVRSNGHDERVRPGEQWPPSCGGVAALERRPSRLAIAPTHRPPPGARSAAVTAPPTPLSEARVAVPSPAEPPSSLAVENDLFAEAVRAKNAGLLPQAAEAFGRLIAAHPKSPLVESAMVQRMRILATVDLPAAARLANEYLARFPAGVARPEAERLAARPTP